MTTISQAVTAAADLLRASGVEDVRLSAEALLAHVLGAGRIYLIAHADEPLFVEQDIAYTALVARRSAGEPVAYLTGHRGWYDLDLRVTPDVLVPRPETEGLLERALAWAGRRTVRAVVDVGTGSGALAIALARSLPRARVYATDVSPAALTVAQENSARIAEGAGPDSPAPVVTFLRGDLLAPLAAPVDLIVANLPYIGEREYEGLARDVRLYEPRLALVGGAGGHELTVRLLAAAPRYLRPGGALYAELGPPQANAIRAAARAAFPRAEVRLEADYAGLIRYLAVEDHPADQDRPANSM